MLMEHFGVALRGVMSKNSIIKPHRQRSGASGAAEVQRREYCSAK